MVPSPAHVSQRPPLTLKENRPGWYPRTLDSGTSAKSRRILSKTPVYVAALDRGVRPMGCWSTATTLSTWSTPEIESCSAATVLAPLTWRSRELSKMALTRVDLPEPDTPVTATNLPSGMLTVTSWRLLARAPLTVRRWPSPERRDVGTAMVR